MNGTTITATGAFNSRMGVNNNPETAYDYNGNILSMTQNGLYNNAIQAIDQLAYTYIPGTNKLLKVRDQQTTKYDLGDFYDGDKPDTDDYEYDWNGNLTKDGNKNIQTITYNQLNLPQVITIAGKGTITYTYDATGNKLSKLVNENGNQKTTLYLGGMVFENNNLQFIGMEEGRVRAITNANNQTTAWAFDYFLKDHLGNVRMMLAENGEVLEETHYYPFGLVQKGISYQSTAVPENKKKFNGIEQTKELGLNQYDAFFRTMDPQLGRWWQIDPKPNFGESMYSAISNNPILYSDFLGDTVKYAAGAGGDKAKKMVEKFSNKTIINKKGKEVANKHYNEAFANVIGKLDGSADNFVFNFDANATEGLVSYGGKDVNITIAEPGAPYGTNVGAEGILFEETKHAEQVLDGKTFFGLNSSGKWGASTNLQNEIEAKMFAAGQLGVNKYYTEQSSGANLQVPTQLGYLKYTAKTEVDKMLFLRNGVQNLFVTGANGRTGTVNLTGAYPTLTGGSVGNTLGQRTKTDKIFGYPPK